MVWEKAIAVDELENKPAVVKFPPKQIALFKANGRVYAVDNRCPHEGYPLAEGSVDENCVLTCNWHNWKFQLDDGECILGGDHVRSYPVKEESGHVWVDTADPPPEVIESKILDGLQTAFKDRDFGRICREITRLHFNQLDPLQAVCKGIEWSYDKLEFGATHAFAAAADWVMLANAHSQDWEKRLICLAETVDHMAFDSLRFPVFAYADPGPPFSHHDYVQAVEAENREATEGMVQRGMQDGLTWSDMEEGFAEAAFAHYSDFGHSVIYVYKLGQLAGLLRQSHDSKLDAQLALSLTRQLCYATREDLLPEFKDYSASLDATTTESTLDEPMESLPFPSTTRKACMWVTEHFSGANTMTMFDALLEHLARNTLLFDASFGTAYDRPVTQSVGWLNLTHGITFANAVRNLCEKYPRFWRQGLLQMACFIGRNRRFLDILLDETKWLVDDPDAFFVEADDIILDHGLRDPIFSAHLLKTTKAVEEELPAASPKCRKYLLAALNRFLHSPIKQKHTRRLARQAIDLVQRDFS